MKKPKDQQEQASLTDLVREPGGGDGTRAEELEHMDTGTTEEGHPEKARTKEKLQILLEGRER